MLLATFAFCTLDDLLSTPEFSTLDDLLSTPVSSTLDDLLSIPVSSTLEDLLSAPSPGSAPVFDFFADFAPLPPLDDLEEYEGASSSISPECPDTSTESLTVLEVMDKDDDEEGRTRIFDDLEPEGTYKEEEILRILDDFVLVDNPSVTEESEYEEMAFPALGLGRSVKTRYALEEMVVVVAEAVAMPVARRMDAMLKFMVWWWYIKTMSVDLWEVCWCEKQRWKELHFFIPICEEEVLLWCTISNKYLEVSTHIPYIQLQGTIRLL